MKQFVTIVPSKERQHSENSFTWCFGANTISSVLSWFNLSKFELINTLTSDKQVSRRLEVQLQSHATFKFATSNVIDLTPPKIICKLLTLTDLHVFFNNFYIYIYHSPFVMCVNFKSLF
jgi:hypothetical protein